MNITGKDRKGYAPPRCVPSAFVVSFQAKSIMPAGSQYRFSKPYLSFVSSSSQHPLSIRQWLDRRCTEQSQRIEGIVGNVRKVVGEIRNV